jgi:methyl-accepting chemotaxis protein
VRLEKVEDMNSRIFRKQIFVDKLQYKFLAIIVIYILLALTLSAVLMFLPSILQMNSSELTEQQASAAREILLLHKRFWPAILSVTVLITTHSIFVFHRIFGPLYSFRGVFKEIAEGNLSVIARIRKNDFLHTEEIAIREMITSLKTNISTTKKEHAHLKIAIEALDNELNNPVISTEAIREKLGAIRQQSEAIQKSLNYFST